MAKISITDCTCDTTTGCGDPLEAGCPACGERDLYSACPRFGFLCDGACDCCTPEQQALSRAYYQRGAQ